MKRILWIAVILASACGNSTNGGGGTADTQATDSQIADAPADGSDAAGMDALSDTPVDVPDVQGTDASPDVADTDAGCLAIPIPLTCCCDGDVTTGLVCSAGTWICPKGYGMFSGDQCNGSKCGGPCSLPCPMDVVDTSDAQDDTSPPDILHFDAVEPGNDVNPNDPATLCASTGGQVVTATCCSGASDFPDDCAIGGCTCAPANSKDIQKCQCAVGKCWTPGTGCH